MVNKILLRTYRYLNVAPEEVDAVYLFGSRVYGCHTDRSDYDLLVVSPLFTPGRSHHYGNLNIHRTNRETFKRHLAEHKVVPLECLLGPSTAKLKRHDWRFTVDIDHMRREWVRKANESAERARKAKSHRGLWHAVRILFAIFDYEQYGEFRYGFANALLTATTEQLEIFYGELRRQHLQLIAATDTRRLSPQRQRR